MFMFVAYPWPVPSANIEPPGPKAAVAAGHLPDALAETSTLRPPDVDEMICWSWRERLRIRWYQLRLTSSEIGHPSRRAREQRLKLP
jgi:hypothetical protein